MSSNPLVTIGAINYNNGLYVIETLESIKAQTYTNIELIIVDDCSSDNSVQLIEDWLKDYRGVYQLIKHPKNLGVCATCNDVLRNTSGKYISLMATDDIMMPEKIELQLNMLENTSDDVAAVYSDAYLIDDVSKPKFGSFIQRWKNFDYLPSGNIYNILIRGNFLPAMSLLVKKDAYRSVGFFDENLPYEDYDMCLRLSWKYKFISSDFISVKYRVRKGSLMFTFKDWDNTLLRIYSKHTTNCKHAVEMMEEVGFRIYTSNKNNNFNLFKPYKSLSKKLGAMHLVSRLRFPIFIGKRIINAV